MGPLLRVAGVVLLVLCAISAGAQASETANAALDRQFQSALADYHAGRLTEAAERLEALLPHAPNSYEVHELLGLTYAAEKRDERAVGQLQAAAKLRPDDPAARTNLATALTHAGKLDEAAEQFRRALALEPDDYDANHDLAECYLQQKKIVDALPPLAAAQRLRPAAYDNGYDLALADLLTAKRGEARTVIEALLPTNNTGELHNLLGQIDEKDGKYVEAAHEYETAAHLDPSEDNLFVWGSELLLHRTYEPAIAVFRQAAKRYPGSPRLWIGLGMALYSRGQYEESIRSLLTASDLDPRDPRCYLFLSKAYLSSPQQADEVIARFRRYAELEPDSAMAQYYYAVGLWKGKRVEDPTVDYAAVEALLRKSIALDGTIADAHLQLGILYTDQREYAKSYPEYARALELDPNLPDAHYRLGQYYVHAGEKEKAQREFDVYQKLQAAHQAEVDKERAEVRQFIVAAKPAAPAKP